MSTIAAPLTVEEFLARPEREDGCVEELIDGEVIVSPNAKYNHSLIVTRLVKALLPLEDKGFVVLGEVTCYLDERSLPNPDVAVVRQAVSETALRDGWLRQASELAVEVVSPRQPQIAAQSRTVPGERCRTGVARGSAPQNNYRAHSSKDLARLAWVNRLSSTAAPYP